MIPELIVNSFIFALIFTTVIPIGALLVLAYKRKISFKPTLFGVAAFFLSQLVLRMPLISMLSTQLWFVELANAHFIAYVLFLAITAGLFEESARLGGSIVLKNNRKFKDAISFGLGHGICEVVILVGVAHVNNVVLAMGVNDPTSQVAEFLTAADIAEITQVLNNVNPIHIYMSVLERVTSVAFHVFATVLVFQGVILKKTSIKKMFKYYGMAISAHTGFNFLAMTLQIFNIYVAQVVLAAIAVAMVWYVVKSHDWFKAREREALAFMGTQIP